MFHLVNRNGIQQTTLDPTIDEFYYDGSARYRVISLNDVHGIAQITFLLYITCDSGFCGSRCAEPCLDDNAAGNFTHTSTIADLDVQQNSRKFNHSCDYHCVGYFGTDWTNNALDFYCDYNT